MGEWLAQATEDFLKRQGYLFQKNGTCFQFVATSEGRKWTMLLMCEMNVLTCFSTFPWRIKKPIRLEALLEIENWNFTLREGCFLINSTDMAVLFRIGIFVVDDFCADDLVQHALFLSAATVCSYWNRVFKLTT